MTEIKPIKEFEYDGKTYTVSKDGKDYLVTDPEGNTEYGSENPDTVETIFRNRMTLKKRLKERLASLVGEENLDA